MKISLKEHHVKTFGIHCPQGSRNMKNTGRKVSEQQIKVGMRMYNREKKIVSGIMAVQEET